MVCTETTGCKNNCLGIEGKLISGFTGSNYTGNLTVLILNQAIRMGAVEETDVRGSLFNILSEYRNDISTYRDNLAFSIGRSGNTEAPPAAPTE